MGIIYHYTPSKLTYDELKQMFVSRKGNIILNSILKNLEKQKDKSVNQHYLMLGPRGIGKSHLLGMIYYSIKGNANLSKYWIPLWLSEEEYSVITIRDLTDRILGEIEKNFQNEVNNYLTDIQTFKNEINTISNNRDVFNLTEGFLEDLSNKLKKRFIVIIENFDMFLKSIKSSQEKLLRSLLMTKQSLLFIVSSNTIHNYLHSLSNPKNALYNLFDVNNLDEFDFEEIENLLVRQSIKDDNKIFCEYLNQNKAIIKTIYRIIGGNSRMFLLFYQSCSCPTDIKKLENDFVSLLERLTPYYQSQTNNLPPNQRKIIFTFAKSNLIFTPSQIAQILMMKINNVTAQIKKLVESGFLGVAEKTSKKRGTYYELTERMYRYWHQYRTTKGMTFLTGIIEFLYNWFSIYEFEKQKKSLPDKKELLLEKENLLNSRCFEYFDTTIKLKKKHSFKDKFAQGLKYGLAKNYTESLKFFNEAIEINSKDFATYNNKGVVLEKLGKYNEAIECYYKAIELKPDSLKFYLNISYVYILTDNFPKSLNYFDEGLKIYFFVENQRNTNLIIFYLYDILKISKIIFAEECIKIIEKYQSDMITNSRHFQKIYSLHFNRILIEYLKTGNENIIDCQPKEIKITLREMLINLKAENNPLK